MKTTEQLEKEVETLKLELKRIKDGIKRANTTMIVDGNDMADWGWTLVSLNNQRR